MAACQLLELPNELIEHILAFLPPTDLVKSAYCCRALQVLAYEDRLWRPIVNSNLPEPLPTPTPFTSFHDLYAAHHPHWYLTKHRIWFGDAEPNGKLLLASYDSSSGCIEAHTITAVRGRHTLNFWEKDRDVIIHSFDPQVSTDQHQPVLRLVPHCRKLQLNGEQESSASGSVYGKEVLMDTFSESGLYSSFMLCKALPSAALGTGTAVWPPMRFPAESRTRNNSTDGFSSAGHRPSSLSEVSLQNFRLRKWVQYTGRKAGPNFVSSIASSLSGLGGLTGLGFNGPYFSSALSSTSGGGMNIRFPEDITTYATLPPSCYTPTPEKPWQGIWCGDYSGHGCEFLVIIQPDQKDEQPLPDSMSWLRSWFRYGRRGSVSSGGSFASAVEEIPSASEHVTAGPSSAEEDLFAVQAGAPTNRHGSPDVTTDYKDAPTGRLEAIKLTGDPNIPRGEITFIAPDIGHGGFLRVADEEIFRGARIVRSAGHIAGRGFREGENIDTIKLMLTNVDQYTPSQLIMVSHDRLAQFWEGFGHISYYQRVDLNTLGKAELRTSQ